MKYKYKSESELYQEARQKAMDYERRYPDKFKDIEVMEFRQLPNTELPDNTVEKPKTYRKSMNLNRPPKSKGSPQPSAKSNPKPDVNFKKAQVISKTDSKRNLYRAMLTASAVKGGRLKSLGKYGYALRNPDTGVFETNDKGYPIEFRGVNEAAEWLFKHDGERWGGLNG